MTDYYIFRHGDTIESQRPKFSLISHFLSPKRDTSQLDILPESIPILEKIGKYLKDIKTDANFCSPYLRCINSANIAGKVANKKYSTDERLKELESIAEPFPHFSGRIKDFLEEMNAKNYKAVSICTHGAVIAAIKHLEVNRNFNFIQVWDYPSPGILTTIIDRKITQINFNKS